MVKESGGANCGSQCPPTPPDSPRPRGANLQGRLPARLPQTGPDTGFVPGGQGVAGSNPAVPTITWQVRRGFGSQPGTPPDFGSQPVTAPTSPTPATSRPRRRYLTGPLAEPPRRGWLRRRRFPGSDSCHGCPLVSCRGTLRTRATVSSLLSPPLKASTACWMASAIRAADMSPSRATTSRSLSSP
jgi:hypothetical protein